MEYHVGMMMWPVHLCRAMKTIYVISWPFLLLIKIMWRKNIRFELYAPLNNLYEKRHWCNNTDATLASMLVKSPETCLFNHLLTWKIKASHYWHFVRDTDDLWISFTKGHKCGKCFIGMRFSLKKSDVMQIQVDCSTLFSSTWLT